VVGTCTDAMPARARQSGKAQASWLSSALPEKVCRKRCARRVKVRTKGSLVRAPVAHGRRHNVPGGEAQEARKRRGKRRPHFVFFVVTPERCKARDRGGVRGLETSAAFRARFARRGGRGESAPKEDVLRSERNKSPERSARLGDAERGRHLHHGRKARLLV
jgi:hypothetical protein